MTALLIAFLCGALSAAIAITVLILDGPRNGARSEMRAPERGAPTPSVDALRSLSKRGGP